MRSAFNTQGQGVVSTSSAESVEAVSARADQERRCAQALLGDAWPKPMARPGVRKIAGSAMAPVKTRTGDHTHPASLRMRYVGCRRQHGRNPKQCRDHA